MEICIIGTKNKSQEDLDLMNTAKEYGKVLYVPITNLALLNTEEGSSVRYRTTKLSKFDALLFNIPKKYYPLACRILKNLEKNVIEIQNAKSFFISASKLSLFHELALKRINVPRTIYSEDTETICSNLKKLRYPILIKVPTDKNKFMIASSRQEAKTMVDALKTLKQPLLMEEYYPENKLFQIFVINNEVVCSLELKNPEPNYGGGKPKIIRPSRKMIETAISAAKTLGTEIAIVKMLDTKVPTVVDVAVCPFLKEASELSEKNISEKIFKRIKEVSQYSTSTNIFSKLMKEFKEAVKETFS